MTALSKHGGKYGKPCPVRQREVSCPTLASSSLSSTCSFLLYPQGLSSAGAVSRGNDVTGGLGVRIQSLASSQPGAISPWSIPFLPKQPEAGNHLSRSPRDLRAPDSVPRPLLPVVAPSPGVPISWGLPPLWLTSGSLALCGPCLCPLGARTGSRALTSPAAGGARVTAAGASGGSARTTDPHSRAGPPGTRAGSDVRAREGGAHRERAGVNRDAALPWVCLHLAALAV